MNVRELPGATLHPVSLQHWRTRAEDWLTTRRASRPPALATDAYLRWIQKLPGEPTLVTDPVGPEHLFLYWYLHRFAGQWPFVRTSTEAALRGEVPASALPVERVPDLWRRPVDDRNGRCVFASAVPAFRAVRVR